VTVGLILESVFLPGASLYEIKNSLEVELMMKNYEFIIIVGGRNGGYFDNVFDELKIHHKVFRNDNVHKKYLNKNDKTHPNESGVILFTKKIIKALNDFGFPVINDR
jgi:hypothetical protein